MGQSLLESLKSFVMLKEYILSLQGVRPRLLLVNVQYDQKIKSFSLLGRIWMQVHSQVSAVRHIFGKQKNWF